MQAQPSRNVTYQRPWLYPKQEAALFGDTRYSLVEASTKTGKTTGCIVWLFEKAAAGMAGQNFWWIAPTHGQSKIAFVRMGRAIPQALRTLNRSEQTITLPNGAIVWFKSGEQPDNLYGEDVYAAVIDEASRLREEAWHALRSTLTATNGVVRMIGNVKGRRNWFYKMARKAQSGEPGMHYAKLIAADAVAAGILSAEEIEDAKRQLPESVFRELYLAEPSDDEGNPFGITAIRACAMPSLSDGAPVVWGWDLAKWVDWTWGIALDAQGRMCRSKRWQGPWESTISRIHALTGNGPALVDSTGVGDPVLESLQKGHPNIQGFKFSQPSKQQLMDGLAVAIQSKAVGITGEVLISELESFEYVYTRSGVHYSAPQGSHDDGVYSLALAVQARGQIGKGAGAVFSFTSVFGR